ncbi:hypothetical protein [Streptodolium elevatio]|uniref:Uncharacterized protein n=1 Tax=Streptodolium elevatio TaxID=3157996 RepID=A0ABV3DSQ9_9ACTN
MADTQHQGRILLDGPWARSEFVDAPERDAPRWVPVAGVPDPEAVAVRAPGRVTWSPGSRSPVPRLAAPDGVAVLAEALCPTSA